MERVQETLTAKSLSKRAHNIWRYGELLPLPAGSPHPPQPVGWTPIIPAPRLASWCGVARLRLKDDGRNPTASFKDRASAVAAAHARSLGTKTLACASTGNAASSLAGMTAGMGQSAVIFIPEEAPAPKVTQLLAFGAVVVKVRGGYAAAFDLCSAACERFGWYNRNCAINPYLVEGKKTCGLEIAEQCAGAMPSWVVISVGDGCTIAGVWKGLRQMHEIGIIEELPRMLGVQADGARPIADAFDAGLERVVPVPTSTIADSINVGTPRNDTKAIQAVRASKGAIISVSDAAILEALRITPQLSGVFGEPAGVAGVAGIKKAVQEGLISPDASVLTVVTGNGLKDINTAQKAVGEALLSDPDLDQLEETLKAHGATFTT
jgi:threonine synthase